MAVKEIPNKSKLNQKETAQSVEKETLKPLAGEDREYTFTEFMETFFPKTHKQIEEDMYPPQITIH